MKKTILILIAICFSIKLSLAATVVVTNTNDSGTGSLRDAVNSSSIGDIIKFSNSIIASGSDTITLTTPININEGIFIKGLYNSTDTLFINGANLNNMFYVDLSNSGLKTLDIDSLVLINGNATNGGAIQFSKEHKASLIASNSIFRNNSAVYGGAIYLYASSFNSEVESLSEITITNCIFSNNSVSEEGGAIFMRAYNTSNNYDGITEATVKSSTFNNNSAKYGGAIYTYATQNNSSGWAQNPGAHSLTTITTTTFVNNSASFNGGAIYSRAWGALYIDYSTINITNSTLTGNVAYTNGSAIHNQCNDQYGIKAKTRLKSSIVAFNTNSTAVYNDNSSTYNISQGYNIFDSFAGVTQSSDQNGATTTTLNLSPLQNNGNNTLTRVPNLGSIAINLGDPSSFIDAQNRTILGRRDVGAAESNICSSTIISSIDSTCQGSNYNFRGQILQIAGNYADTISDSVGCDTIYKLTLSFITPQTPTITITASPSNTIMAGTSVTFSTSTTHSGSTPAYQWKKNGFNVGTNNATYTSNTLNNNDVITCELTSNFTCTSTANASSNSITMNVAQNNDEPCNAIALPVNINCNYSNFDNSLSTLTTSVPIPNCVFTAYKDIWFKVIVPASGQLNIYTQAGTLTDAVLTVYYGNSCTGIIEFGCIDDVGGNTMPFTTITGGTPGETLHLRLGGANSYDYGTFGICAFDPNISTASINENNNEVTYTVYPNPAKDIINIEFKSQPTKNIDVKLYNLHGQIIKLQPTKTQEKVSLDVSNVARGSYILKIINGKKITSKKIIITH